MNRITDTELFFLKIIWNRGESTAREVHEESLSTKERKYISVKTTLDIMHEKGFLKRRKIGPVYLYASSEPRRSFLSKAIDNFAKMFLDYQDQPLVNYLANKNDLEKTDLAKIDEMLNKKKDES